MLQVDAIILGLVIFGEISYLEFMVPILILLCEIYAVGAICLLCYCFQLCYFNLVHAMLSCIDMLEFRKLFRR